MFSRVYFLKFASYKLVASYTSTCLVLLLTIIVTAGFSTNQRGHTCNIYVFSAYILYIREAVSGLSVAILPGAPIFSVIIYIYVKTRLLRSRHLPLTKPFHIYRASHPANFINQQLIIEAYIHREHNNNWLTSRTHTHVFPTAEKTRSRAMRDVSRAFSRLFFYVRVA